MAGFGTDAMLSIFELVLVALQGGQRIRGYWISANSSIVHDLPRFSRAK
jgi:hypothetical protein